MFVVVGLGNPGSEYENTRHNIGFNVVDQAAQQLGIKFTEGKGDYVFAKKTIENDILVLVKPLTYMNNSGVAVKEVMETFDATLNRLLIVIDDFNIPLGTVRIRLRGSSGGHNGLYSVIYNLQTEEFARLRCGIAGDCMPVENRKLADYVLSPFTGTERVIVQQEILNARDAINVAIAHNLETAMNRFNNLKV